MAAAIAPNLARADPDAARRLVDAYVTDPELRRRAETTIEMAQRIPVGVPPLRLTNPVSGAPLPVVVGATGIGAPQRIQVEAFGTAPMLPGFPMRRADDR